MATTMDHTFRWTAGAEESVYATGTFDQWGKSIKLDKVDGVWQAAATIPASGTKIAYKYIVDGKWATATDAPKEVDEDGNENNILIVPAQSPTAATAGSGSRSPSAAGTASGTGTHHGGLFEAAAGSMAAGAAAVAGALGFSSTAHDNSSMSSRSTATSPLDTPRAPGGYPFSGGPTTAVSGSDSGSTGRSVSGSTTTTTADPVKGAMTASALNDPVQSSDPFGPSKSVPPTQSTAAKASEDTLDPSISEIGSAYASAISTGESKAPAASGPDEKSATLETIAQQQDLSSGPSEQSASQATVQPLVGTGGATEKSAADQPAVVNEAGGMKDALIGGAVATIAAAGATVAAVTEGTSLESYGKQAKDTTAQLGATQGVGQGSAANPSAPLPEGKNTEDPTTVAAGSGLAPFGDKEVDTDKGTPKPSAQKPEDSTAIAASSAVAPLGDKTGGKADASPAGAGGAASNPSAPLVQGANSVDPLESSAKTQIAPIEGDRAIVSQSSTGEKSVSPSPLYQHPSQVPDELLADTASAAALLSSNAVARGSGAVPGEGSVQHGSMTPSRKSLASESPALSFKKTAEGDVIKNEAADPSLDYQTTLHDIGGEGGAGLPVVPAESTGSGAQKAIQSGIGPVTRDAHAIGADTVTPKPDPESVPNSSVVGTEEKAPTIPSKSADRTSGGGASASAPPSETKPSGPTSSGKAKAPATPSKDLPKSTAGAATTPGAGKPATPAKSDKKSSAAAGAGASSQPQTPNSDATAAGGKKKKKGLLSKIKSALSPEKKR